MSADGQLEASLEAFEKAWQAGQAPAIADFLARAPLELRPALLEELVKIDLECRWRRIGECAADLPAQPRLEDYLQRFPELAADVPVTLIGQEYRVRQWWGDAPAHFEFAARFPQHAERLNDALRRIDDQLDEESARQTRSWSTTVLPAEPVLDASSVAGLVEAVHALPLLRPTELAELAEVQTQFKDAHGLAREMLQRDWLTAFQVNQLLQGRGFDLVVGPYILLERLGEGGTGWVFKARHQHMNRLVALKVLRRELLADAEVLGRFYREIQVVSQLSHAHVVHAYDAGPLGRMHALVMEYAPGVTLSQLVKKNGPLPIEQATEYICQAARGLQHIHERGLIHRDVKPSNLLVTWERSGVSHESPASLWGTVKVLDLGLSRLGKVSHGRVCGTQSADGSSAQLTPQGAIVVGTPDYLAPEQAADFHGADIRADIYSLGASFFALVTGKPPFAGNTTQKLLQHQMAAPPSISTIDASLPKGLSGVAAKMLAKKPHERYQTPAEVIAALAPWLGNSARVLAGVSRTNLGAGVDLHARLRRSEDALNDSGVVDPADPASETGAMASAKTSRSTPRPVEVEVEGGKRKWFPIAAGTVAVAASLAGIAFALGLFDREPSREQTQAPPPPPPPPLVAPSLPAIPPAPNETPKVNPPPKKVDPPKKTPALPEKLLAGFDLTGVKPFAVRTVLEVKANGNKEPREVGKTGTGTAPAGWTARAWNKDTEMEFLADATPALGIRNVRGPGSAMLFTPKVNVPTSLCRLRVDYTAPVKDRAAHVRFKPNDTRGAWDAARLASTPAGVWKSSEFVIDLKGATGGYFEFHNNDTNPDGLLRVRSVVVTEPPPGTAPTPLPPAGQPSPPPSAFAGYTEGAVVYRFDADSLPPFRATKEGHKVTAGEAAPFPRGISGTCWKQEATGEFRRDEADGSAALGVTNFSDLRSGQYSFELERDMGLVLRPGTVYRAKVSYLLRNDATGSAVIQTAEYKTVATTTLAPGSGWRTATVSAQRADQPLRLTIDNNAVGEGNVLYFRSVEIVELVAPK